MTCRTHPYVPSAQRSSNRSLLSGLVLLALYGTSTAVFSQQASSVAGGTVEVPSPASLDTDYIDNGTTASLSAYGPSSILDATGTAAVPLTAQSVVAQGGGTINMKHVTIQNGGRTGAAVIARNQFGSGSAVNLTNSSITMGSIAPANTALRGLESRKGTTASATDSTITVNNGSATYPDPTGAIAWSSTTATSASAPRALTTLTRTNVFVSTAATSGASGTGARANTGGQVDITDGTITVGNGTLSANIGVQADANANDVSAEPSRLTATNTAIVVSGDSGHGAEAKAGGHIVLTNGSITVTGNQSAGLFTTDIRNAFPAGPAQGGATIEANNLDVGAIGADSAAISMAGTDISHLGFITVTGGSLTTSAGPIIQTQGAAGTITLQAGTTVLPGPQGGNTVLAQIQDDGSSPSQIDLNAIGIGGLIGDVQTTGSSTINMALKQATTWTGASQNTTKVGVDASSKWQVSGNSTVTDTVSNSGSVSMADGAASTTLTVGNWEATGSPLLIVDTCLGDSTSASDQLVVNGNTSGPVVLQVQPVAGPSCQGAPTTGNGILLVTVNGASNGSFALGPAPLTQGNYAYQLQKAGGNWYLQATQAPPGSPPAPKAVPINNPWTLVLLSLTVFLLWRKKRSLG